jgi:hypothetical protein
LGIGRSTIAGLAGVGDPSFPVRQSCSLSRSISFKTNRVNFAQEFDDVCLAGVHAKGLDEARAKDRIE